MKRKIAIVSQMSILPVVMMSQKRTLTMILSLVDKYDLDLFFIIQNEKEENLLKQYFQNYSLKLIFIKAHNHYSRNLFIRFLLKLYFYFRQSLLFQPIFPYTNNFLIKKQLLPLLSAKRFDFIIVHSWYMGWIFDHLPSTTTKITDTHGIKSQKKTLETKLSNHNFIHPFFVKRYIKFENLFLNKADIIISNAKPDYEVLKTQHPQQTHWYIPNGIDNDYKFPDFSNSCREKSLLFYGSMMGNQNTDAFERFWINIYPVIKNSTPDIKIYVVGANPPDWIKALHSPPYITITGYVKDPIPFFLKSMVLVLPLELGGGFRGRIIEVMAAGVVVVGTHNALDCIGIENGKQGYICDNYSDIAYRTNEIVNDLNKFNYMSRECVSFVKNFYSYDATYLQLNKLLEEFKS